jgi:hypothetical protein
MLDLLSDMLAHRPGMDRLLVEGRIGPQFFDLENELVIADHYLVIWRPLFIRGYRPEFDSVGG